MEYRLHFRWYIFKEHKFKNVFEPIIDPHISYSLKRGSFRLFTSMAKPLTRTTLTTRRWKTVITSSWGGRWADFTSPFLRLVRTMLWLQLLLVFQEQFLVPDHTIKDISGASFAGFYYICFQKSTATIEGYYYHRSSEW